MGAIAFAPAASAHASLETTEPAAGAILQSAPDAVTLHFTEPIQFEDDSVRVFNAARERVDQGRVEKIDGRTISVPLDDIGDGGYVVAWKVVSADGHPIGGGFTWRVGESSVAVDPNLVADLVNEQRAGRAVGVAAGIDRFLVFTGMLLLVGGAVFVGFVWPAGATDRRVLRLLWCSWGVVLIATVAGIGLQGASLNGVGLLDAFKPSVFGDVLDTTFGKVWLIRLALLAPLAWLLGVLDKADRPWWRVDVAVIGLAIVATPAFSGHADSGRWLGLAKAFDIVHVAGGAVWIGGIAVLLVAAVRKENADARAIAERFSPIAFGAVSVVVLSGTFQSVRQVTTLDALETSYGRILAVKIVLVLTLIGVASLSRAALQGRLALGDEHEEEPVERDEISILRRLVGAEVAVALIVLAVTALLVDANPGYATTSVAGPFDETKVVNDDILVNVVAVPGSLGPTDIHLYVDNPAGGLTPPVGASGTLSLPSGEIGGIDVTFVGAGPGHWSAYDVDLPIAGQWELTVDILLTDVDEVSAAFTIPIGGTS
jgi:copper transport protein